MGRWAATFLMLLAGCGGDGEDSAVVTEPTGDGGACGAVTKHNLQIRAKVVDTNGAAVSGVELRLVEEGWYQPAEVFGSTSTGADGIGELSASNVVAVEDCWGIVLNYTLQAQQGDRTGSMDYNSPMFNAIKYGTFEVDTTSYPIEIE